MPELYRYSLKGRSLSVPGRIIRLTVTARDADEAREYAKLRDPDFGTTVETPRRLGVVLEVDACRFCKRDVSDGLYQRVSFPDGVSNVCDDCFDKAYEKDRYATWRGTEVEVV